MILRTVTKNVAIYKNISTKMVNSGNRLTCSKNSLPCLLLRYKNTCISEIPISGSHLE